jgi:anti-sigma28 factor (negative regulator of flagellin synthesis)
MSSADRLQKPTVGPELNAGQDQLAEEILHNMNNTPVGKLLAVIAALPEVRQEKVDQIKLELSNGTYDLEQNLDVALDAILEELMIR